MKSPPDDTHLSPMPDAAPPNPSPGTQDERAGARQIAGAVALAAVGFVAVAGLLHAAIRDPLHLHADVRSEKLLMLDRLQGTVYSAVFGSSHIHNGFDPRVFDRETAGSPAQTHTVNLAIEGGSQAEQRVMALEFLRHLTPPPKGDACLVILELNAGANFQSMHLVHPRSINVYDWPTARFVSHLTDVHMSLSQRVGRTGFAMAAFALHAMNVGMLSNRIFAPPIDQATYDDQTANDQRGQKLEQRDAKNEASILKEIAGEPAHPGTEQGDLTPGNSELIAELAAASPQPGISFVYFVYPKISDLRSAPEYPDHIRVGDREVPILNLARPDLYPALYDPKLWHDDAHLDEAGAKAATAEFAGQLKGWYAAHGAPPACTAAPARSGA